MIQPFFFGLAFSLLAVFSGCTQSELEPEILTLTGPIFGTKFNVTAHPWTGTADERETIAKAVLAALNEVDRQMSTYREDSEISEFNRVGLETPVHISPGFMAVFDLAIDIAGHSDGAYDPTVGPLVRLWGFRRDEEQRTFPSPQEIRTARQQVGFSKIRLHRGALVKRQEDVTLDLGSIAKGFAVDEVFDVLAAQNFSNIFVEIGGEVRVSGLSPDGDSWVVGIEKPTYNGSQSQIVQKRIALTNPVGIATSGDYRQFFERDGRRYSHIIDPRTGYPTESGIASATVVARTCMEADGLATALCVTGVEEGLALIAKFPNVEALIYVETEPGVLKTHTSPGWLAMVSEVP